MGKVLQVTFEPGQAGRGRWFGRLICKPPQQAKGRTQLLAHILLHVGPTVVLRLAVKQKQKKNAPNKTRKGILARSHELGMTSNSNTIRAGTCNQHTRDDWRSIRHAVKRTQSFLFMFGAVSAMKIRKPTEKKKNKKRPN